MSKSVLGIQWAQSSGYSGSLVAEKVLDWNVHWVTMGLEHSSGLLIGCLLVLAVCWEMSWYTSSFPWGLSTCLGLLSPSQLGSKCIISPWSQRLQPWWVCVEISITSYWPKLVQAHVERKEGHAKYTTQRTHWVRRSNVVQQAPVLNTWYINARIIWYLLIPLNKMWTLEDL